MTVTE